MLKERLYVVRVKTPITDDHSRALATALEAVSKIQILEDFVEVKELDAMKSQMIHHPSL